MRVTTSTIYAYIEAYTLFATSLTFLGTFSAKLNSLYLSLFGLASDRQSNTSVSSSIEAIPREDRGMEIWPTAKSPVNRALYDGDV
jgi:hypothetical protein